MLHVLISSVRSCVTLRHFSLVHLSSWIYWSSLIFFFTQDFRDSVFVSVSAVTSSSSTIQNWNLQVVKLLIYLFGNGAGYYSFCCKLLIWSCYLSDIFCFWHALVSSHCRQQIRDWSPRTSLTWALVLTSLALPANNNVDLNSSR